MKELIIAALILVLILCIKIRIKVYKQVNQKIIINLIITKSLRIKINLTNYLNKKFKNYIYDTSKEKKVYDIKKAIETLRYHKELINNVSHIFNGNIIYFSINSFYYLDNLQFYLALYYLYSFIQNSLYINLNKVSSTCFKTRVKNTSFNTEIYVDLETYVFKILLLLIKRRKEIFKIKEKFNEQPSNNRIIKNINVKH